MRLQSRSKIPVYLILFVFVIFTALPLLWIIMLSFKTSAEIVSGSVFALPKSLSLQNYLTAWNSGNVGRYFLNSVIVSVASSVVTLVFGIPLAYSVSRLNWKLKDGVFTLITIGIMLPIHATLIPIFMVFSKLGLVNTYWSLIITYSASALPITVYIVRNFLISVPYEIEEAAFLDGCSVIRAFFQVMVPTIKQSVVVVTILNFLSFWNEYVMAVIMVTEPKMYTLPVGLAFFQNQYTADYGAIAACTVISVLPVLVFYLIYNDVLEKGMVVGAMK